VIDATVHGRAQWLQSNGSDRHQSRVSGVARQEDRMSQAAWHGPGCDPARRRFLISLAAFGASTALSGAAPLAQTPAKPRLVDVHHHIMPSFFVDALKDRVRLSPAWFGWSPQKALDDMDQSGVATAIVSYSTPGVWLGDVQKSRALARRCSEYAAKLTRDNPGRFGFFAALPLPDTDGSLREIDHAFGTLKADGIGLMTSYDDRWLGDPAFAPVFEELDRRKAVVYVHPTAPACCRSLMSYVPPNVTEFIQDTNRAITSLMFSGSLGRLSGIRFVFSHAGGAIPVLAGRIAEISRRQPQLAAVVPNGIEYELRRLHYEVANSATRPAIAALTSLVPIGQILFGSDYPIFPISMTAGGLSRVGLSGADLQAIERDNAMRLLPRLKT
jgi:predicted TIM-barrel fold metal-dependent hydrolase